jgi:hypothetical protein
MNILEMIHTLKKKSTQLDFLIVLSEMKEELEGLDDYLKFKIVAKTIEISHKSCIISHNKVQKVPKVIYEKSILQGKIEPLDFVKKWIDGTLDNIDMENLPKNDFYVKSLQMGNSQGSRNVRRLAVRLGIRITNVQNLYK